MNVHVLVFECARVVDATGSKIIERAIRSIDNFTKCIAAALLTPGCACMIRHPFAGVYKLGCKRLVCLKTKYATFPFRICRSPEVALILSCLISDMPVFPWYTSTTSRLDINDSKNDRTDSLPNLPHHRSAIKKRGGVSSRKC